MFDQIRQWLAVPVFDDEDKARVARILNVVLLSSLAVAAVFLIAVPFIYPNPLFTAPFVGAAILLLIGMLWLMRRGHVRLASVGLVSVLWGIVTFRAMTAGGVQSSSFGIYTIVSLVAGFLLGWRAGVIFIAISMVAGLGMIFAETRGVLPEPLTTDTLASTWAAQTAGSVAAIALLYLAINSINEALARARGYAAELEEQRENLEETVKERTRDLELRAVQLATATDVGRAVTSILELETLTHRVVELVQERFGLYYAGLFLLDEEGRFAVLEAGTGEAGRIMKENDHKLRIGGLSMVGAACAQRQARIALDVGAEPARFDNPLLPDTRSEMALPLVVGDRVLGVLDVQSTEPTAFSEEDIAVLQLVAGQVAVAVDNARKFSEEAALLEATSPIFRASRRTAMATTTGEVIQAIMASVAETEADGCALALFDLTAGGKAETFTFLGTWDRRGDSQQPTDVPSPADAPTFPLEMVMTTWTIDDATQDTQIPEQRRQFLAHFRSQALVNVPLRTGDQIIGFMIVYRIETGRFSPVSMRLYETMADQAAVALERAHLLEETQQRAQREQSIRQITDKMRRAVDIDDLMRTTVEEAAAALGASGAFIQLATPPDRTGDYGEHPEL